MANDKTATPQDPGAKALATARSRALTAARKSLGLIEEAVARHKADLEDGNVPDATFTASVLKYEGLRSVLEAFGKLAGGEPVVPESETSVPAQGRSADMAAEVQLREDVAALVTFITTTFPAMEAHPGYPLFRLREFAGGAAPSANGQGTDQVRQVTEAMAGAGTGEVAAALAAGEDEPPY